jgi:RimJ/RimL family protein N-acetyltransferase
MQRIIETARLSLRPPRDSDAAAIMALINDYDISKNLARVPFPYTLEDAQEFLRLVKKQQEKTRFSAICLKQQPEPLQGLISYEWNAEKQSAELGYWLAKPHWGQGLMSEAAIAMLAHAFEVAKIDTLTSCYFFANPASGKVLQRAGFAEVGTCMLFSKAQDRQVPVTNVKVTRTMWDGRKAAPVRNC